MRKGFMVAAIFEIIIGLLAVVSFVFLAVDGENMGKWTVTLVLAVSFIVIGIIEIIRIMKQNQ